MAAHFPSFEVMFVCRTPLLIVTDILFLHLVYRWCAKCTELYLELFYSTRGCPLEYKEQTDSVIDFSRQNLYEELKWIVNLTTLAYSRRGCQGYNDGCFDDWCQWILNELKPNGLQHIWLPFVANVKFDHPTSSVKSFFLGRNVCQNELDSVMPEISHLGGVSLSSFSQLPHLRLFQGSCSSYPVCLLCLINRFLNVRSIAAFEIAGNIFLSF